VVGVSAGVAAMVLSGCSGAGAPERGTTGGRFGSSVVLGDGDAAGRDGHGAGTEPAGAGPATTAATAPAAPSGAGPVADPAVVVTPTGVVAPVVGRAGGGFLGRTPCGSTAAVARATPVGPVAVVIDPGHGGGERGTVGPNGLDEASLNLAVAQRAAAALAAAGFPTLLTRTSDIRVTLATRAEIAQRVRPRAFVSIHHNADPDGPSDRPGSETYYQVASPASRRLAGLVYEEVLRALTPYAVAWVADADAGAKYRRNDRGGDYYGILRRTAGIPAVLAELAYLSNPPEAELLARPDVQRTEGEAVARGVVRFLTTDDPGSGYTEPYPRTAPAGPGGGAGGCVDPALG
jgi:N-acetylmuramoyl-L-alanine amidase